MVDCETDYLIIIINKQKLKETFSTIKLSEANLIIPPWKDLKDSTDIKSQIEKLYREMRRRENANEHRIDVKSRNLYCMLGCHYNHVRER